MSQAEKALIRLQTRPKDFEWDELVRVLERFGYELKTVPGSSRKFIHPETKVTLMMHEPHPSSVLKAYQVRDALEFLRENKHI